MIICMALKMEAKFDDNERASCKVDGTIHGNELKHLLLIDTY